MSRVFANGPGDRGSIPGRVILKTPKMVLDAALINTQHFKVRVKDKVEESREWSCGDLGINRKNSQPDIDSSAARYKMYKCVATHKAPRIHPVKIRKRKIIKCKIANEKRSRQN